MKYQPPSFCVQQVKAISEAPCSLHMWLVACCWLTPFEQHSHALQFMQLLPDPHWASLTCVLGADLALRSQALASRAGYPHQQCCRWKGRTDCPGFSLSLWAPVSFAGSHVCSLPSLHILPPPQLPALWVSVSTRRPKRKRLT